MPGPSNQRVLGERVVVELAQRLCTDPELKLPASLVREVPAEAPGERRLAREYLEGILRRDPAIFLERHGALLTAADVGSFEALRGDYEIDFWCKNIEERLGPSTRAQEVQRKNRRMAHMARLEAAGDFFSMSEMRGRCPLLHQQLLGRFASQSAAAARLHACPRTGGVNSEMVDCLLEAAEERRVSARLARLNEAEAQVEYETDSDSDDEEGGGERDKEGAGQQETVAAESGGAEGRGGAEDGGGQGVEGGEEGEGGGGGREGGELLPDLPPEEMVELEAEFTRLMKERFLSGQEGEHVDYAAIDANADLDRDLMREINQDLEDAYFDDM